MPTGIGNFEKTTTRGDTVCDRTARASESTDAAGTGMRAGDALNCVSTRGSSLRIAVSLAVLAAAIFAVAGSSGRVGAAPGAETSSAERGDSALYTAERDGLRYEFHAVMGTEILTRVGAKLGDARNLIHEMPEIAASLRAAVAKREGVPSVESLRARHGETIESLRRLGYL